MGRVAKELNICLTDFIILLCNLQNIKCSMIYFSFLMQISLTKAERSLGFVIQTCFISPNSYPDRMSEYTIIENVCPKDESVRFFNVPKTNFPVPNAHTDKKRFSFLFKSTFNSSLLFLHCEVTLCTKKEKDIPGLAQVSCEKIPLPFSLSGTHKLTSLIILFCDLHHH